MFAPYTYAPKVASQGRQAASQPQAQPQQREVTATIRVPVRFEVTSFPDMDFGDPAVVADYFILFPVESSFDQLHIGWDRSVSGAGYAAHITCQLMQATQDAGYQPLLKEALTFTSASPASRVLVDSGLPIAANYPIFLRITANTSGSDGAAAANPSGPWFTTSGLRLLGTLHLLQTEVT